MLPGVDGLDICRQLRAESGVPIIMLTARVGEADRVVGLELGADDYVTKPFSPPELVARVRATLRRVAGQMGPSSVIRAGDVALDTATLRVAVAGQPIDLTASEFQLLATLARHPGQVLRREQLLEALHGTAFEGYDRSVDSHIKNLAQDRAQSPRAALYPDCLRCGLPPGGPLRASMKDRQRGPGPLGWPTSNPEGSRGTASTSTTGLRKDGYRAFPARWTATTDGIPAAPPLFRFATVFGLFVLLGCGMLATLMVGRGSWWGFVIRPDHAPWAFSSPCGIGRRVGCRVACCGRGGAAPLHLAAQRHHGSGRGSGVWGSHSPRSPGGRRRIPAVCEVVQSYGRGAGNRRS